MSVSMISSRKPPRLAKVAGRQKTGIITLAIVVFLSLTSGCGPTEVAVKGEFPAPLMEKLPLTIGVYYGPDFSGHEFFDETTDREKSEWIVRTGDAQVSMWNTLLPGMFNRLVHVNARPEPAQPAAVDAVLVPHVAELQYTIPKQTNIKVYEIWMRYHFELLSPTGEPIAEWTMPAYGKTPTAFLQSDQAAVNLAAVVALRDAGANFATSFNRIPPVHDWLLDKHIPLPGQTRQNIAEQDLPENETGHNSAEAR
ncbi:MAG: hypothetical protein ACK5ME_08790 [Parahaliea sp.]